MKINFEKGIGFKDNFILYFSRSKLSSFENMVIEKLSITLEKDVACELNRQIKSCIFKQVHRIDNCTENLCYSELMFVPKRNAKGNFKNNKEESKTLLKKGQFCFDNDLYRYKIWSCNGMLLSIQVLSV